MDAIMQSSASIASKGVYSYLLVSTLVRVPF